MDGHRINNSIYDQAMIGNELPVDIDLVERVEVVRGPSSSLYGSNAFFGVINVITKRAYDVDGAEVSGSAGSWRTFTGRATLGKDSLIGGPEILLSGTVSGSHGQDLYFPEFDDPATNNGVAENDDGEKFHNLFAKIAWGGFTLEGVSGDRKKRIPTASYDTIFNDDGTYTGDRQTYLDLRYEKDLPGGTNLLARTYYDHYYYWGGLYLNDPAGPDVVNKDYAESHFLGGRAENRRDGPGTSPADRGRRVPQRLPQGPAELRCRRLPPLHRLANSPPKRGRRTCRTSSGSTRS